MFIHNTMNITFHYSLILCASFFSQFLVVTAHVSLHLYMDSEYALAIIKMKRKRVEVVSKRIKVVVRVIKIKRVKVIVRVKIVMKVMRVELVMKRVIVVVREVK